MTEMKKDEEVAGKRHGERKGRKKESLINNELIDLSE